MPPKVTGPLFKWFGSKWLSSKTLPQPTRDSLIEPFAGGAGYALRHCHLNVLLAESDVRLHHLWVWLIRYATEAAIREIPIDIPVGTDIRHLELSVGQELLLKNWQRTNNVGNCWTISPWGNKPGQWTANTRARVAEEIGAIKHWNVATDDGFEVMKRSYFVDATWFIDPPYQYNYQYGKRPIDYEALGKLVDRCAERGQVIVCEAVCPKTGRVPTWLPFKHFGDRITSRRKPTNNHHSKELIWVSA